MRRNKAIILSVALTAAIASLILLGITVYKKQDDPKENIINNVKNQTQNIIQNTTQTRISTLTIDTKDNASITKPDTIPDKTSLLSNKSNFKDTKVKGVYLTGNTAGNNERINHFINLAKNTEINALVIDIKEGGKVYYRSQVPLVKNNKLDMKLIDPQALVKRLHDSGIYAIARIVCFKDDGLATKRPDLAIKKVDGTIWREGKRGSAWINPYYKDTWKYNVDIAKEAVRMGFDEIQFDYVRFPTAKKAEVNYGTKIKNKAEIISSFLSYAEEEITTKLGIPVSADVFGIIAESPRDGQAIGQDIKTIGLNIFCISPMIYPSHYANSSKGVMGNGVGQSINGVMFTAPDLQPYDVVYNSLLKLKEKTSEVKGYKAKIRPYLQDFTATYLPKDYRQNYGVEQVRQQIKAVYAAGYEEWLLWDASNTYTENALERD